MDDIVVRDGIRERLEALTGRRREVRTVGAVVAAVTVVALLLWLRSPPARIAPPAVRPPAASPPPAEVVLVHVAGAVRRPGLYELEPGARVADALEAARGPRHGADLDALNLAEPVGDGSKVFVPPRGEALAGAAIAAAPSPTGPPVVDINVADQAALETIPGIGPVKAAAILADRAEIGAFARVEQLLDVDGIGPATLEAMRQYVTL